MADVPLSSLLAQQSQEDIPLSSLLPALTRRSAAQPWLDAMEAERQAALLRPSTGERLSDIASKTGQMMVEPFLAGPRLMGDVMEGRLNLDDPEQMKNAARRSFEAVSAYAPGVGPVRAGVQGMAAPLAAVGSREALYGAPVLPVKSAFELPEYAAPKAPANTNFSKEKFQWIGGREDTYEPVENTYKFLADQHGRTLAGIVPEWHYDPSRGTPDVPGYYTYSPQLSIQGNGYYTRHPRNVLFDNVGDAQQYVEKMLSGGRYDDAAHNAVMAELAPQIAARQREQAAQAARRQFSIVPPEFER